MDSEASQSGGMVSFLAWVEINKQKLIIAGVAAIVAIAVISIIIQRQAQREQSASEALSNVRLPFNPGAPLPPGIVDALSKVVADYQGTRAASRALLLSAGVLFQEGKYAESQSRFNQVIQQYADSPWAAEANFGVAAALEAQGKTAEATAKFEEVRRRFANAPIAEEVKFSLARLYVSPKPEEAFKLTQELLKGSGGPNNSGIAMEAAMLQEDLIKKHPELAKFKEPLVAPTPPVMAMTNQPIRVTATNRPTIITSIVNRAATNIRPIMVTNQPGASTPGSIQLSPVPSQNAPAPAPNQPRPIAPAPAK
jgi:predicted negative regulator of RcsB-dependent stress response